MTERQRLTLEGGHGATEERARRQALRQAVRLSIADIESGRFTTFACASELSSFLLDAAEKQIETRTKPHL